MDVLSRDATFEVMKNMDDETLLNFCKSNRRNTELCRNENFWQNRIIQKFPDYVKFKSPNRKWKNYYLSLIRYLNLEFHNPGFYASYFTPKNSSDVIIKAAAGDGDLDIVNLAVSLGGNPGIGIGEAIKNNHLEIVRNLVKHREFTTGVWYLFLNLAFETDNKSMKDFILKESVERYGEYWTKQQKDILEKLQMFGKYPYFH